MSKAAEHTLADREAADDYVDYVVYVAVTDAAAAQMCLKDPEGRFWEGLCCFALYVLVVTAFLQCLGPPPGPRGPPAWPSAAEGLL